MFKMMAESIGTLSTVLAKIVKRCVLYCLYCWRLIVSYPFAVVMALLALIFDLRGRYVDISWMVSLLFFRWGEDVRYYFYKLTTEGIGKNVVFKFGSICHYRKTQIGDNVLIGFHTVLGEIRIGDDVLIGSHVLFLSGNKQHGYSDPEKKINEHPSARRRLQIGSDILIGSKSVIMADIGDRCIIGAGSVVTGMVPSKKVVAGNPAVIIKSMSSIDDY